MRKDPGGGCRYKGNPPVGGCIGDPPVGSIPEPPIGS